MSARPRTLHTRPVLSCLGPAVRPCGSVTGAGRAAPSSGETPPQSSDPLCLPLPSPTSACPLTSSPCSPRARHHGPLADPAATTPRLDGRARRACARLARLQAEPLLEFLLPSVTRLHAAGRRSAPGRPRPDPGPDPRAGRPDRGGAGPAGLGRRPRHPDHLRVHRPEPPGRRPAPRRGRRPGLPGPPRGPDRQGHCDLGSIEVTILDEADHIGRPARLPAGRAPDDRRPPRRPAPAVLRDPRQRHQRAGQAVPQPHPTTRPTRPVAVSTMDHHMLRLAREQRVPVLVDLASAPGRTVVFTRTKPGTSADPPS